MQHNVSPFCGVFSDAISNLGYTASMLGSYVKDPLEKMWKELVEVLPR